MTKYRLDQIGKVIGGGTPSTRKKQYYANKGIAWITPKDLSGYSKMYISHGARDISQEGLDNSSAKLLPKDTVLVSSRAPIGYVALAANKITTNQGFKSIVPNTDIVLPKYLYYLMLTKKDELENVSSGSTFKEVSGRVMKGFEVDIPSLDKQANIIQKIEPITRKIELNYQINANLFKLAKIHFDRQLDSENIKFSQISTIQNGYAFKSKEYVDTNELMILRTKNINDNHLFSKNDVVYISKELFDEYKKFSFSAFDTVLVMVGASIGKTGFVTSNMTPSLQNQNMWRFRPKMSNIPGLLIFQYVNYINKHVIGSATGSARSFYRKKLFSEFEVPRINSTNYIYFDTLQREIDHLNTENEILYRIKHSLLNHYF